MRGRTRHAASFLVVVVVLSLVDGHRRFFAQQQPTFRSGVDVVAIDVNVVDRNGRPVDDLTPQDFLVSVDRKPRTILSATYINHAVRLPRETEKSRGAAVFDTLSGSTRAERTGRNVLVVVDEESMEPGVGRGIVQAAHAFVDNLASNDRVGVATIPRLQTQISFETDRAAVHRALDGISTQVFRDSAGEYNIGVQEAFDIERHDATVTKRVVDRECKCDYQAGQTPDPLAGASVRARQATSSNPLMGGPGQPCDSICPSLVVSEATQLALRSHLYAERSLDVLRDLGQALARIPGAKTVVFVSGGLGMPQTAASLDPLEPALSVGQVSLYTIHVERSQFGQVRGRLSPTPIEDDRLLIYGLENATSAAGGTLIPVHGTFKAAFDRVTTEMSGSYLIGLEVDPSDRNGKPHAVAVKVNRPDVEIRARRQYVIHPERPTSRRSEEAAPPPPPRPAVRPAPGGLVGEVAPGLVSLLSRVSEWVGNIDSQVPGLLCDEQYEQTLSRWKSGAVIERGISRSTEDWYVEKRTRLTAEYALVRAPGGTGWTTFRDVLEVDGGKVHARDGRLGRALQPAGEAAAVAAAQQISAESERFNIGLGPHSINVPTFALAFLQPANRSRFSFREEGEVPVDGQPAVQIGYEERSRPTVFVGRDNRDLPVQGSFWVVAESGILLRSRMKLSIEVNLDQTDVDITVTYKPSADLDGVWVPSELHAIYTTAAMKVEGIARYGHYRLIKPAG